MSDEVTLVALGALGGVLSGLAALWGVRISKRAGVAGDEREARRDTVADRDGLIDQLQEDIAGMRAELTAAKERASSEITDLRTRLDEVERQYRHEVQWSEMLRDHIAHGRGWPPPTRPA